MERNSLLARWGITAVAIWAAIELVPGIHPVREGIVSILVIALIFGFVNALIRPLLMFMTCPFIILTLGLGTLLINTAMFALAGWLGQQFNVGFTVDGFWPAFWGALVVSIVSGLLSSVLGGKKQEPRKAESR
jgi:putative membrane protein